VNPEALQQTPARIDIATITGVLPTMNAISYPVPVRRWFVAVTEPNLESQAKARIDRLNRGGRWVEAKWLKYRDMVRRHGRMIDTFRPLYPGYLFVEFDPDQDPWRRIVDVDGVSRIICEGDRPIPLQHAVAKKVFGRVDAAGILHEEEFEGLFPRRKVKRLRYKRGALVRLLDGAFTGLIATYDSPKGKDEAVIDLPAMGGVVRMTVPEALIELDE
jgi:transcriptional antiterminator RfaH